MERPEWVPVAAWRRLEAALCGQPAHAADALSDLGALVADWNCPTRARLLRRFVEHAERGLPLPAAFICAVSDLLGVDG